MRSSSQRKDPFHHRLRVEPLEDRRMLTVFTVNSLADVVDVDQMITLREALEAANTNAPVGDITVGGSDTETDTINFDSSLSGNTINLTLGQLDLFDEVDIQGLGRELLTINAGGASRVFAVSTNVQATISGLTITGGSTNYGGGGIYNQGTLTLSGVEVSGNTATGAGGGGILNAYATLHVINDSVVANNVTSDGGGGIYNNHGTLTVTDSTISGNRAVGTDYNYGGGISNEGGTLVVDDSTFTGNRSDITGGAIDDYDGITTITSSVFVGNSSFEGGGICIWDTSTDMISNSTIVGNSADSTVGGLYNNGGQLTLTNSIVALNADPVGYDPDFSGELVAGSGFNLIGDDPGLVRNPDDGGDGWGDDPATPDVDESLNDDYGDVHLQGTSTARNGGDNGLVIDPDGLDRDGRERIIDTTVDMGAYEFTSATSIPGDANYDGLVNQLDARILAAHWGFENMGWGNGDFDNDGVVGPRDAAIMAANWTPSTPGDANRDGVVNTDDAKILAAHWGMSGMSWDDGDFDNDGVVGPRDAAIMAAHWTPASTPGDANRDGVVDTDDAEILATHWGMSGMSWDDGDFDDDGVVGPRDAAIMAAHWDTPAIDEALAETTASGSAAPLIGPLLSKASGERRSLLASRTSSRDQLIRAFHKETYDASGALGLAHDTVLSQAVPPESVGPADARSEQTPRQRERLAWSYAMAQQRQQRQNGRAVDELSLAIDLLLTDRGR
ncbi:MAG: hypothetical protein JW888_16840 [Pirellulales bacterium]|nr:hypothetical protein [Pirellulales bacterium]